MLVMLFVMLPYRWTPLLVIGSGCWSSAEDTTSVSRSDSSDVNGHSDFLSASIATLRCNLFRAAFLKTCRCVSYAGLCCFSFPV